MDDLKVGDIVRYGRIPSISARGIITKIETKITKGRPNPRTYAVVFCLDYASASLSMLIGSPKWRLKVSNLKVGDIVKWKHSTTRPLRRGIIVEFNWTPKWCQVFSFNSGQIVLKRMDRLTKLEDRGE